MKNLITVLNEISDQVDNEIGPDTELIMSGVLDSLNIANLITYLEQRSGTAIAVGDIDLMKLSTPREIMQNFLTSEAAQ